MHIFPLCGDAGEQRAIREEYLSASGAAKQAMEKRYGRRTLQLLVDESLTQDWMQENSKRCPHCSIAIEVSKLWGQRAADAGAY